MRYFQTDENGIYLGAFDADVSPLEPEIMDEAGGIVSPAVYLVPSGGVLIEPPVAGTHQAARYDGAAWALVADFRGVEYYTADGFHHVVEAIDDVPPNGTFDAPPSASGNVWSGAGFVPRTLTLDEVKAREVNQITQAANNRLENVIDATRRAVVKLAQGLAVSAALLARIKKQDDIEDARDAAIVAVNAAATKTAARAVFPAIVWP